MNRIENSFVRFGSRSLMALTALAGIILAITVPFIQRQPVALQGPMYWSIWGAGAIALVVFLGLCVYRRWIERISGALLFQPKQSFWMRWAFACVMVPLFTGMLVMNGRIVAMLLRTSSELPGESGFSMFANVCSVGFLLLTISTLIVTTVLPFWGLGIMSLEVREKGVVVSGWKFHPWTSGVKFECQPAKNPNRVVLSIMRGTAKSIAIIESDEREELEQRLRELGMTNWIRG